MPPLNIMLKPASGSCNMRCKYCFYADETKHRDIPLYGMMKLDTLEAIVQKSLVYAEGSCTIGFQGGEPTLRGLDFFKKLIEFQEKYNIKKIQINNAIQTNGILIDQQWAEFFHENNFLVGLSIDGTKDVHDLNRHDAQGKGTFNRVLKAAQILSKYQVEYNILTVVTAQTARNINKIYNFFMKNGLVYQQYIPCLDSFGEVRGDNPYSLTPERYSMFLKQLFDAWYEDVKAGKFVYIRYFENIAGMVMGYPPESCGLAGQCSNQNVIEADGSVYPCDFYMLDEYRLGNLNTDSFEDIEKKRGEIGFIAESAKMDAECVSCEWNWICRGGCRRDRQTDHVGPLEKNYFCAAYKEFFPYMLPRLRELLQNARNRRPAP